MLTACKSIKLAWYSFLNICTAPRAAPKQLSCHQSNDVMVNKELHPFFKFCSHVTGSCRIFRAIVQEAWVNSKKKLACFVASIPACRRGWLAFYFSSPCIWRVFTPWQPTETCGRATPEEGSENLPLDLWLSSQNPWRLVCWELVLLSTSLPPTTSSGRGERRNVGYLMAQCLSILQWVCVSVCVH